MSVKRSAVLAVLACAACGILYAMIPNSVWLACSTEQRLATSERAAAFGRAYLINDTRFWEGNGIISRAEIEAIIVGQPKTASKGDYFIGDDSRWGVGFAIVKKDFFYFQYEIFFDDCGHHPRVEKLWVNKGL